MLFNSKKMKTAALMLVIVMIIGCFAGCGKKEEEAKGIEFTKVSDHLYEMTWEDDFDWGVDIKEFVGTFACSAVQNGKYRGRNYDWNYDDTDLLILHAPATDIREHASVAVCDLGFGYDADGNLMTEQIPFLTVDGINDAGVCIQVNVMPEGENGELTHTETEDDDLLGAKVVRLILDYADNVKEAIQILEGKDLYTSIGGEELHWMITGPADENDSTLKTVVVEIFPDGMHVTEDFVDDKPIMANFNVSNFNGTPESLGIGFGYERWQILNENFDQADSVMGTFDLMEKVYFTKLYDLYNDRFWYSEYADSDLLSYYTEEELVELVGQDYIDRCIERYGRICYLSELWDGEYALHGDISKAGIIAPVVEDATGRYNAQVPGTSTWITIHTSVYDLEELTLDIQVRESQDHFHFTIE